VVLAPEDGLANAAFCSVVVQRDERILNEERAPRTDSESSVFERGNHRARRLRRVRARLELSELSELSEFDHRVRAAIQNQQFPQLYLYGFVMREVVPTTLSITARRVRNHAPGSSWRKGRDRCAV